jgi:GNAT superfamily N-acetyltransferase
MNPGETAAVCARRGKISVRAAAEFDVPLIFQFIRALASYEKLLGEVEATEERLSQSLFPRGAAQPAAHVLIGELDGKPEGFAVYFFNYSTFLAKEGIYLEDIFVRPESRGRGLGKAFLVHLARLAVERGCGRITWSVLDWNEPSIAFYKDLGAVPLDDWTLFRLSGKPLKDLGLRPETG